MSKIIITFILLFQVFLVPKPLDYKEYKLELPKEVMQFDPIPSACSQCSNNQCYYASCNLNCIQHGNWCETIVMGFRYNGDSKDDKDFTQFKSQMLIKHNSLTQAAGLAIGDVVTHINNYYVTTDKFPELIEKMTSGMRLRVLRLSNGRVSLEEFTL